MVPTSDISHLLDQAQATLPEAKREDFIKRATTRIDSLMRDNRQALIGAGVGWLAGEVLDNIPFVKWLTGDHASTVGALLGAWIGHGRDRKSGQERQCIVAIVAEEIARAKTVSAS
jgi:hypothetical protein